MIKTRTHQWLRILILGALLVGGALFFFPHALAQLDVRDKEILTGSGIVIDKTFGATILTMVNYFLGFIGFLAGLGFIYAGVLWVLNMGEDELITKAKKIMTYSSLGIVVILLSFSAVRFITQSADSGPEVATSSGSTCQSDFDCASGELCQADSENGATCQAGDCRTSVQCPTGKVCLRSVCADPAEAARLQLECVTAEQCDFQNGQVCWDNVCQRAPSPPRAPLECFASFHCQTGQFCSGGRCASGGTDARCTANADCQAPRTCGTTGFCRNPNAGSNTSCVNNTDCAAGYVCNGAFGRCEFQGAGGLGSGGITGGPASAASEAALGAIEARLATLNNALQNITSDINALPQEQRDQIRNALGEGSILDKVGRLEDLLDGEENPETVRVLERLIGALGDIISVREELDKLKLDMPESAEIQDAWNETSEALNALMDDPDSGIKLRRFETKYRGLRDLIRRFPVVIARIRAVPAEGNVPFTVTLDGLDSIDPTGGTISDYRWSYLDNQGNEISLGSEPVIVHEFTEPNTYAVRLQVSTSRRDENGYKTASDGVSTVRVKANPPASQVNFRINGAQVQDVHRVTVKEGQAGLTFDPSLTVPALGRVITTYEWFFGDTATETRTTPTVVIHGYPKAGEYFVKLVVTDNHQEKDQRVVKLFVKSLAADISISPRQGGVNTQYQFQGLASRSDDGSIVNYQWTIEDSAANKLFESEEQTFFYKFDRPGEYRVGLLVSDITGARDNATVTLKVISRKPVANFIFSAPESNHPNRVEFDASGSYDPDEGDILKYSWDFDGDGSFEVVDSPESRATFEYKKTGTYRVRLQVQDHFGERNLSEDSVGIDSVLSAEINLVTRAVRVGDEVEFNAESSTAVSYLWEFGDGETASSDESKVKHIYRRKGRYTVRLHFFDAKDGEGVDTATLLVGNSDTPVASITTLVDGRDSQPKKDLCGTGKDGLEVTRSDSVLFSAKESINTDGSPRLLVYDWRFSDGNRNDKKEFTRRFDELTPAGQCLEVSLVVRDSVSGKGSEEEKLLVRVVNAVPTLTDFTVEVKPDQKLLTPLSVHLKAVNPKDSDGVIKRYKWSYVRAGDESTSFGIHNTTVPETDMVITAVGQPGIRNTYSFILEITDNDGGVYNTKDRFAAGSSVEIENGPNLSPVAAFTMDKTAISVGDSVSFVSQAYDPQGDALSKSDFAWDFDGDGKFDDQTSGPNVNRQFNTPGEYQIRLKVTHRGLASSATERVFVEPTQSFPQAAFSYTIHETSVTFDASNSRYDPDLEDKTLRYEWDFDVQNDSSGNGVNDDDVDSTEPAPTKNFGRVGVYRVRLKVKDSLGMEGVVVRDVDLSLSDAERQRNAYRSPSISSVDQALTSLDITLSPAWMNRGQTADVSVNVFNADNTPYSGKLFFEIVEGSGELTPSSLDAKNGKGYAIFTATDPGAVRLRVRAPDTIYGSLTEEAVVHVNP